MSDPSDYHDAAPLIEERIASALERIATALEARDPAPISVVTFDASDYGDADSIAQQAIAKITDWQKRTGRS